LGVSTAVRVRGVRSPAERWSVGAFLLAAVGLAASIWFIVVSQTETDQVRWWLVLAPVVVTVIPLLSPRYGVRVAAMLALGAWCILALFSIGMLQLPALIAAVVAVARDA
jgi:hypothetical protein